MDRTKTPYGLHLEWNYCFCNYSSDFLFDFDTILTTDLSQFKV
jgi:hypothetical protein